MLCAMRVLLLSLVVWRYPTTARPLVVGEAFLRVKDRECRSWPALLAAVPFADPPLLEAARRNRQHRFQADVTDWVGNRSSVQTISMGRVTALDAAAEVVLRIALSMRA